MFLELIFKAWAEDSALVLYLAVVAQVAGICFSLPIVYMYSVYL